MKSIIKPEIIKIWLERGNGVTSEMPLLKEILEKIKVPVHNYYIIEVNSGLFEIGELSQISWNVFAMNNESISISEKEIYIGPTEGIFMFKEYPEVHFVRFHAMMEFNIKNYLFILIPKNLNVSEFFNWLIKKVGSLEAESRRYKKEKKKYLERCFLSGKIKENMIKSIEIFLSNKPFYEKHRLPWKMGVLLYGPPGNGKTLFLKAMGEHFNLDTRNMLDYTVRGEISLEEKEISCDNYPLRRFICYSLSNEGIKKPSLYYIEDLDKRIYGSGKDIPSIPVSEFLQTLDGVDEIEDLIVFATTNYKEDLISAIVSRPGRFDIVQEIGLPDEKQISDLLDYFKFKIDDREELISRLKGSSMSFVEKFIKSCILEHKKSNFVLKEIEDTVKEINKHMNLSEDFRKKHGLGF